jgi:RecB family exonuclease
LEIRLSYSAASAYEKCPLSYRFQYIDRIEIAPSPYLSFGRSLHLALEWLYRRDIPQPPALEDLLSYLDSSWESDGYKDLNQESSFLDHAHNVLTLFYRTNVDRFSLPEAIEERFEIEMDGYILSGVIDRIDRHEDGSYEIIDYKTNRRLPELNRLREDLQLPIYQMACCENWGISPSKLTFYYLVVNKKYSTKPYSQERLFQVRERLSKVAALITAGEFPSTPNRLCSWCSYEDICPERTPSKIQEENYISRHQALLRRREGLNKIIDELESEMLDLKIAFSNGNIDTSHVE